MRDLPSGDSAVQLGLFELEKADAMRKKADEWVRKNPDAWLFIRNEAVSRTDQRKRFGIGELCEQVRWDMYAQGIDSFKVNNTIRAALARRLIAEYPPCKDYIEIRSSVCDL